MHSVIEKLTISSVAIVIAASLFAANEDKENFGEPHTKNQTVIEEPVGEKSISTVDYLKDKSADQTPGDAAMLYHIPGLTLTETAGPLSSSQIRYHGLSNARMPVDVEGLALTNPLHGILDANALFLFAAEKLTADAQSLSIKLPKIDKPQAKGVFGYGSHHTFKLGASAGTPLSTYSSIFAAMQAASTGGDFSYTSEDVRAGERKDFVRKNNDQNRLQTLVKFERVAPTQKAHALIAFNAHEGGIAGSAFSPTKNLRQKVTFSGVKTGISQKVKNAEFSLDVSNSVFDYTTTDRPGSSENLTTSTHEFTFGMAPKNLPSWLNIGFDQKFIVERAYQLDKTRLGGGFVMHRTARWSGRLKPTMEASMSIIGYNHRGIIRNKNLSLSIEPFDFMNLTGRVKYSSRIPTFMEMYAKNRFFVGNDMLDDEGLWDIELATDFRLGQHSRLYLNGFMGFIGDIIVYVPSVGTQLRPTNTGVARRYGVDLGFSSEPFNWLMFESKNSILTSKIKATNAPLPQTPTFLGLTRIRFGTEDFLSLTLQSRYRGSATANIYGTLRTKPYGLFDVIVAARLLERLGLSLSISNIFNVKSARDTYEMPLPGIIFFGQIEVGNV